MIDIIQFSVEQSNDLIDLDSLSLEEDINKKDKVLQQGIDGTEKSCNVMIWKLRESFFVWIGSASLKGGKMNPLFPHLVCGMPSKFGDDGGAIATTVSDFSEVGSVQSSHGIAKRLSLKTNEIVHVSSNLGESDLKLIRLVEKQIVEKLT